MQGNSRVISGLSIATTVLSGITVVGSILCLFVVILGGSFFNAYVPQLLDYEFSSYPVEGVQISDDGITLSYTSDHDYDHEYDHDRHGYDHEPYDSDDHDELDPYNDYKHHYYYNDPDDPFNEYYLNTDAVMDLGNFGLFLGACALLWIALMAAVSLVGGILGIRGSKRPQKLGIVFGWNIAGAICALLSGRMITMVLQIIVCVFAYREKNRYLQGGAPVGASTVGYGQPYPGPMGPTGYAQNTGPTGYAPYEAQPFATQPSAAQPFNAQPTATPPMNDQGYWGKPFPDASLSPEAEAPAPEAEAPTNPQPEQPSSESDEGLQEGSQDHK